MRAYADSVTLIVAAVATVPSGRFGEGRPHPRRHDQMDMVRHQAVSPESRLRPAAAAAINFR